MKKMFLLNALIAITLALSTVFAVVPPQPAQAATTLSAGDIAIIGINTDDPDAFAFVLLRDITSGTEIKFTDNGWLASGSFRTGEGILTWSAAADMSAGTIVTPAPSPMVFSASGDQILAYQGADSSPTFIYGLNDEGTGWQSDATNSNTSALPTGLTNGDTAVALNEIDNAVYNCATTSGTAAQIRAAIGNTANWTGSDTTLQTMPTCTFTITGADTPPTVTSTTPTNGATNVPVTSNISITFNETVTIAPDSFFDIFCSVSGAHTGTIDQSGNPTFVINPSADFNAGETCTVTIDAASVTDQDGTPQNMVADYTLSFTTAGGDIPPAVVNTIPANAATNVAIDANLTVEFSEPVTLASSFFDIFCSVSGAHTGLADASANPTIVINPDTNFQLGETCTVTIDDASVTDQDGTPNPMIADYVWSFATQSPEPAPTVTGTNPANAGTAVALDSNLVITFSEPVNVSDAWFGISCTLSGDHSATVSGGPGTFTLNPDNDFDPAETCTVTIENTLVTDQDTDDPYDEMQADYQWSFTTTFCGSSYTAIHDIQGFSNASPIVGASVTTEGIVTADLQAASQWGGFFLQAIPGSEDVYPNTSEGIFAYGYLTDVNQGDRVRVTGTVVEYTGSGSANAGKMANMTELTSITLEICATGQALPTATVVDLPDSANPTFTLEAYEGMLVTLPETLTVQQNYYHGRFGQVTLGAGGRIAQMHNVTKNGGSAYEYTRMIVLDDASQYQNANPMPYYASDGALRAGDTVAGVTGVLDQGRINSSTSSTASTWIFPNVYYRLQPTTAPTFVNTPRPTEAPEVGGRIKIASANVLNYFPTLDQTPYPGGSPYGGSNTPRGADNATEFTRQQDKLVAELYALNADVFGLMEIESWDGAAGGIGAPQALVNALNAHIVAEGGSDTYAVVADPGSGQFDPSEGGDYIQVALIYKTQTVTPISGALSSNDAIFDRSPFAQLFKENATNDQFIVVVNHFKSKSSCPSDPLDPNADQGDGQGCWNAKRIQQATALLSFINTTLVAIDPDVLVIGDLNSYGAEDPILTLVGGGLINQVAANIPVAERYSYVFDGTVGYLDHGLSTASFSAQINDAAFFHINADEPVVIDYNLEFKGGSLTPDFYQPHIYRASDHDPLLIGLDLNTAPIASDGSFTTAEDTAFDGQLLATDINPNDTLTYAASIPPAHGTVEIAVSGSYTYTPASNYFGSDSFTFTVSDGNGGSDSATITITITPVNDAPIANDASISTAEDTALSGNLTASDVDSDTLTFAKLADPAHGTVSVASDGAYTYTPASNYFGSDSFTFTVSDGNGGSDSATITITVTPVNDAPIANDASISTAEDTALSGNLTASDVDSDTLTFAKLADPAHGTVSVASDGAYTYTPASNYFGSDSFTFTVSDGNGGSDSATITITVTPVNDAPIAAELDDASWLARASHALPIPAFSDVDSNLTYTATLQGGAALPAWLQFDAETRTFTGTPANADIGDYILVVTADDGEFEVSSSFTLTVTANSFQLMLPMILR